MIRLIEALNYRCLKYIRQPLAPFHVLVGPNATGKTTFLDAIAFLARLVSDGVDAAVSERSANFYDLVWRREGARFALAVEAAVPNENPPPADLDLTREESGIRYEVVVGLDSVSKELRILDERLLVSNPYRVPQRGAHASDETAHPTLNSYSIGTRWRTLTARSSGNGEYVIFPEVPDKEAVRDLGTDDYRLVYRPTSKTTVFRHLSEAEFPSAAWLERFFRYHLWFVNLSSAALHNPSPPVKRGSFMEDGSSFHQLVENMEKGLPERYGEWIKHVRTALPNLEAVRVVERPEDRHRYLMVRYRDGLEVPSWMLSEGTLRLLALTVIPYTHANRGLWLIEEPENSIHPLNIETVMQSLSSVYQGQVMIATHSPVVLAMTELKDILVFENSENEGVRIVPGTEHPRLREWKGEPNLSVLFAGGVLG
jgi:predicted ATPase